MLSKIMQNKTAINKSVILMGILIFLAPLLSGDLLAATEHGHKVSMLCGLGIGIAVSGLVNLIKNKRQANENV